jgi:hypothetical protein
MPAVTNDSVLNLLYECVEIPIDQVNKSPELAANSALLYSRVMFQA